MWAKRGGDGEKGGGLLAPGRRSSSAGWEMGSDGSSWG